MGIQALTRDGSAWEPRFLDAISAKDCIGCGRCFKVCGQDVLKMMGMTEDDELVEADDDDSERMIMTLAAAGACNGCGACARVCGSKAMSFIDPETAWAN